MTTDAPKLCGLPIPAPDRMFAKCPEPAGHGESGEYCERHAAQLSRGWNETPPEKTET